ncbi:MAG TPA: hypothetical protein VGO59_05085 [Verrucomicrobiae bacterium]|jgi:hypothetical protein
MKSIFLSNGLTRRTADCLARLNIPMTKKAVIKAIREGTLYANCIPRHYGPQTHKEICRWAGVNAEGGAVRK